MPQSVRKNISREVRVVEIDKNESRKLNRIYRNRNKPTNVLSFRYSPDYGEILICPGVIRQEAKAAGNTYKFQMTWMILHGMIHLAGLHHEKSRRLTNNVERLEFLTLEKLAGKNVKFKVQKF